MAPKKSTRIVSTTSSKHTLSVGPLRATPVGAMTLEQLQSAAQLIAAAHQKATETGDELALKRLRADRSAVDGEIERRELSAA